MWYTETLQKWKLPWDFHFICDSLDIRLINTYKQFICLIDDWSSDDAIILIIKSVLSSIKQNSTDFTNHFFFIKLRINCVHTNLSRTSSFGNKQKFQLYLRKVFKVQSKTFRPFYNAVRALKNVFKKTLLLSNKIL